VRFLGPGVDDGGSGDETGAATLATFSTEPVAWISEAREQACVLVNDHGAAILAIAAALLDRGALDSRQLRD
jgi:hypothetical protein